ncbi:MAG: hypothetical protein U5K56_14550 [Halioglobus sp.]|nr:hypothetical protein [Halioglobus sp.]
MTIANWVQVRIFELTPGGFSLAAVRNVANTGAQLVVAGTTVFYGDPGAFFNNGQVRIYEAGDGFVEQSVTPSTPENYPRFGTDLSVVGDNEVLVNSEGGSFWLRKDGEWSLTPTGVGESFSGEGGQFLAHRNVDGDFTVERTDTGEFIGVLQDLTSRGDGDHWSTNGRVIVHVSLSRSNSTRWTSTVTA